jgi:hypothetical protein
MNAAASGAVLDACRTARSVQYACGDPLISKCVTVWLMGSASSCMHLMLGLFSGLMECTLLLLAPQQELDNGRAGTITSRSYVGGCREIVEKTTAGLVARRTQNRQLLVR